MDQQFIDALIATATSDSKNIEPGCAQRYELNHSSSKPATHDDHDSNGPAAVTASGQACEHVFQGDIFLIIGLPEQFKLGLDTIVITVPHSEDPSALLGLRDLPSGAHFIWVSPPGAIVRQGFWFLGKPIGCAVHVKQWDRYNEVLGGCASQHEAQNLADRIDALQPKLLSYGDAITDQTWIVESADLWRRITSCIDEPLLRRVSGTSEAAGAAATRDTTGSTPLEWYFTTTDTAEGEMSTLDWRTSSASASIKFLFSPYDVDPYLLSAGGAHTSKQNLELLKDSETLEDPRRITPQPAGPDTTDSILAVLSSPAGYLEKDIVGELQFAFITGTLLGNVSCLEQWWHIVLKVFLRARRLISSRPRLLSSLIRTLHAQFMYLEQCVTGGFPSSVLGNAHDGTEDSGAGIFDIKIHATARLEAALAAYKFSIAGALLASGGSTTEEQKSAEAAFADFESWLCRHGWDLSIDPKAESSKGLEKDRGDDEFNRHDNKLSPSINDHPSSTSAAVASKAVYDSGDEDDQPVLVELDEEGREVGLVSWN